MTRAGKSLYQDTRYIIQYCRDSVTRAKNAMQADGSIIRIGTSPMTPAQLLMRLWPRIQARCPDIKFQIVPFENMPQNAREILGNLGRNIDVVGGIFDETMLDIVNETAPKLAAADAFVIGSPVYFASPAGGAISFMDRLFFSTLNMDKTMKVGAAVVTCRRGGNTATFDVLNKYFSMTGMPIVTSQYWNMVHGGTPEEVLRDREGLQTVRTLGRNMAFLMKSIRLGKEQLGLPEKEETIFTNFHH